MIPQNFQIGSIQIYTLSLFLIFGFFVFMYVIWREAKKEGFEEEQVFDLVLSCVILAIFSGRLVYALEKFSFPADIFMHTVRFWTYGVDLNGVGAGLVLSGYLLVRGKKWSMPRVTDVFALSASAAIPFVILYFVLVKNMYEFLIAFGLLVLIHVLLLNLRKNGFVYGGIFGIGLMLVSFILGLFFIEKKSLIFLSALFTLGLVVLVHRLKGRKMKLASPISKDFLKNIRDLLLRKDKELAKEETLLKKEDAYNLPERDVLNNEEADEAFEDTSHEMTSILSKSISEMRLQIRKALAKINIGTYGICEVCHKPIDPARLKAFPQATMCLECAEKSRQE
ncbi:hypothetical protein A2716_00375 [candidate division WWE3 bacterium RIFCSPHIGHO2_01_FULL_40_23]|uniref:Zinc finger DksA/TraR C4-type domain-containing protein n=1 Tax=candidate division WWE3 bacterium RIFCSPLOWO2_01_FULL_41_18 TaxID=1802625 RepID=A0A1F4VDX9_UNCKA|nr:MAG: hypothetical protein A2716_00375 [candidate division WWE3 bacterium RIFCSPHIGHO2_01_FULL_40_23]OGC55452.1 MAG: hypothetical protein A3A78_00645 [candidate division WWE3 bacterium RIFCSPLOWO2_01_FULL_41_18]